MAPPTDTTDAVSAQVMVVDSPRITVEPPPDSHGSNVLVDDDSTVICVTGGAGFIGSHFINFMWSKYSKVRIVNLDCLYYCANIFNVDAQVRESENKRYTFYKTDLADSDAVETIQAIFKMKKIALIHV